MGYAERSVMDTKIDTELKKLDRIQGLAIKSTLMITEEQMVTMNLDDDFLDDELDYYEEEYGLEDGYEGFEKIRHPRKSEEEFKAGKKRSSVKHQKRPDKE